MKYFFILGNNPTLSIAEISAVFELNNVADRTGQCPVPTLVENVLILETNQKFDAQDLIKKLGGTIKIGEIADDDVSVGTEHCSVPVAMNTDDILNEIKKIIETKIKNEPPTTKFNFGISNYTNKNINTKIIGMELKTWLKEKNISCRFVVSQEKTLSSVVVEQNKLLKSGIEIVIIPPLLARRGAGGEVGSTLAVQPFKELSFRDYGRPARDDLSGMLPPKLAQIMINLSGLNAASPLLTRRGAGGEVTILDPFCGSGTILTEAILMGFQNLIGSDLSRKAINDTEKNIDWVQKKFLATNSNIPNVQLHNVSAPQLSQKIQPNSIDLIATEPYLGPQRGKIDLPKIIGELTALYSASLKEFFKVLKPGGRVVMVWPVWEDKFFLNPNLNGFKIAKSIPESLKNNPAIKLTARQTIIYGRPGQKVWREIVVLTK